jgi:hypothetical protein
VRSIVAGDPATLVGDGFDGGLETGFRAIHATVAPKATGAVEEPVGVAAGYRIVLRCAFQSEDD